MVNGQERRREIRKAEDSAEEKKPPLDKSESLLVYNSWYTRSTYAGPRLPINEYKSRLSVVRARQRGSLIRRFYDDALHYIIT